MSTFHCIGGTITAVEIKDSSASDFTTFLVMVLVRKMRPGLGFEFSELIVLSDNKEEDNMILEE